MYMHMLCVALRAAAGARGARERGRGSGWRQAGPGAVVSLSCLHNPLVVWKYTYWQLVHRAGRREIPHGTPSLDGLPHRLQDLHRGLLIEANRSHGFAVAPD